jgi:hypothetical protein
MLLPAIKPQGITCASLHFTVNMRNTSSLSAPECAVLRVGGGGERKKEKV